MAVNPRFCQITGYSETEMLSRTYQQITHPDDLVPDITEAQELAADPDGNFYQMVKRYIRKDGHTVWVNLYVYAIRDENGAFKHFFVFVAELTPVVRTDSVSSKGTNKEIPSKFSLIDYFKHNPKEALIVVTVLLTISKGEDLMAVVGLLFGR